MSDKSPRQSLSKKSDKSLKQKRTDKHVEQATVAGGELVAKSKKR